MNDQHFINSIRATNRAALLALALCSTAYGCFEAIAAMPNLATGLAAACLLLTAIGFILACVGLGRSATVGSGRIPALVALGILIWMVVRFIMLFIDGLN